MSRVLVTGASGFLGKYAAAALVRAGKTTVELTRSRNGSGGVVCDLEAGGLPALSGTLNEVYHLAGLAHMVPRNDRERSRFFLVNRDGTRKLLAALDACPGVPRSFVLISTVAVYGVETGSGLDESTPRRASDPYGASKREAEDLVSEWCAQRGVRCGIVRLPLVVGTGAPGNLRAMAAAMKAGRYFGIGDGSARRSMVSAADVAAILPTVAECGGTFHLTDGDHPMFAEVETALARSLGLRTPPRIPLWVAATGARACDGFERLLGRNLPFSTRVFGKMTSTLTFSDENARKMLGWNPSPALESLGTVLDRQPC